MRDLEKKFQNEEISYSRMVEILNETISSDRKEIKYQGLWTPEYLAKDILFPKPVSIQAAEQKLKSWAHDLVDLNSGYTACQEEDRWVPVSEWLPEDSESRLSVQVLTVDSIGRYLATQYHHQAKLWMKSDLHAKITHWKPITPPNRHK